MFNLTEPMSSGQQSILSLLELSNGGFKCTPVSLSIGRLLLVALVVGNTEIN